MTKNTKGERNILKESLSYVGKLFSIALLVLLVLICVFLVFYLISYRAAERDGVPPRFSLFTIISPSMEPSIRVYDVIVNRRIENPSTIQVGDVITFISTSSISRDMVVTHRVIDIREVDGEYEFVTKGDNNPAADSDTAKADNLIGRTLFRIPQLGRVQFFIGNIGGWIAIVVIPAMLIIIYDIIRLSKIYKAKKRSDNLKKGETDLEELNKQAEDKKIEESIQNITRNAAEILPEEQITSVPMPITEETEPLLEETQEIIPEVPVEITLTEVNEEDSLENIIEEPIVEERVSTASEEFGLNEQMLNEAIEKMKATYIPETLIEAEVSEDIILPEIVEENNYQTYGDEEAYIEAPVDEVIMVANEVDSESLVQSREEPVQDKSNNRNHRRNRNHRGRNHRRRKTKSNNNADNS